MFCFHEFSQLFDLLMTAGIYPTLYAADKQILLLFLQFLFSTPSLN